MVPGFFSSVPFRFLLLFRLFFGGRLFFCKGRDEDEGRDIYTVLATLVVYMYTQYVPCGGAYFPPPPTHAGALGSRLKVEKYACWARVLHVGVPPQSRKIWMRVGRVYYRHTHTQQAGWVRGGREGLPNAPRPAPAGRKKPGSLLPLLPTVTCHMIITDQTGTLLLYYIIVI